MASHFKDTSEDCSICLSPLSEGACLTLSCGHIYHDTCIKEQLRLSRPDPSCRLLFPGCHCAQCKQFCDHPSLEGHVSHPRQLLTKVDALIRHVAPELELHEGRRKLAFYQCSVCLEPFFGGEVACIDDQHDELPNEERVCDICALSTVGATCTNAEHSPFHVWKCRLCCNPSTAVCFGRTHFCDECHTRYSNSDATPIPCPGKPACKSPMPAMESHTNGIDPAAEQLLYCAACLSGPSQSLPATSRNLLVNGSGERNILFWTCDTCGGWQTEDSEVPFSPHTTNFVSSYFTCVMSQAVDMSRFLKPRSRDVTVSVSARYSARTDCPSVFMLEASVLDSDFNRVALFQTDYLDAPADCWEIARHTFQLGQGRYIVIRLKGRDSRGWAGNYGSKVTDCNVSVVLGDMAEEDILNDAEAGVDDNCRKAVRGISRGKRSLRRATGRILS